MAPRKYSVAVVGATGAVGAEIISILASRGFPVERLLPLASDRSLGRMVEFGAEEVPVEVLQSGSFAGMDFVFFSAGAQISKEYAPAAIEAGAIVIDNSSAHRQTEGVPLVVPEVNPKALMGHKGMIANPNCAVIELVVALKPLHELAGLQSVTVTTFQSASGAGSRGMEELVSQTGQLLNGLEVETKVHARRLAFNVVPQIGTFEGDGFTDEEHKIMRETATILDLPELAVAATAVRVPVLVGHSESVSVKLERKVSLTEVRQALQAAPGVVVLDDPGVGVYPTVLDATEQDPVLVGRLRLDPTDPCGVLMWVVADNLRKGAALNAVQIAELLVRKKSR